MDSDNLAMRCSPSGEDDHDLPSPSTSINLTSSNSGIVSSQWSSSNEPSLESQQDPGVMGETDDVPSEVTPPSGLKCEQTESSVKAKLETERRSRKRKVDEPVQNKSGLEAKPTSENKAMYIKNGIVLTGEEAIIEQKLKEIENCYKSRSFKKTLKDSHYDEEREAMKQDSDNLSETPADSSIQNPHSEHADNSSPPEFDSLAPTIEVANSHTKNEPENESQVASASKSPSHTNCTQSIKSSGSTEDVGHRDFSAPVVESNDDINFKTEAESSNKPDNDMDDMNAMCDLQNSMGSEGSENCLQTVSYVEASLSEDDYDSNPDYHVQLVQDVAVVCSSEGDINVEHAVAGASERYIDVDEEFIDTHRDLKQVKPKVIASINKHVREKVSSSKESFKNESTKDIGELTAASTDAKLVDEKVKLLSSDTKVRGGEVSVATAEAKLADTKVKVGTLVNKVEGADLKLAAAEVKGVKTETGVSASVTTKASTTTAASVDISALDVDVQATAEPTAQGTSIQAGTANITGGREKVKAEMKATASGGKVQAGVADITGVKSGATAEVSAELAGFEVQVGTTQLSGCALSASASATASAGSKLAVGNLRASAFDGVGAEASVEAKAGVEMFSAAFGISGHAQVTTSATTKIGCISLAPGLPKIGIGTSLFSLGFGGVKGESGTYVGVAGNPEGSDGGGQGGSTDGGGPGGSTDGGGRESSTDGGGRGGSTDGSGRGDGTDGDGPGGSTDGGGRGGGTDGSGRGGSTDGGGRGGSTDGGERGGGTDGGGQGGNTDGSGQGDKTNGSGQGGSTDESGQGGSDDGGQEDGDDGGGQGRNPSRGQGCNGVDSVEGNIGICATSLSLTQGTFTEVSGTVHVKGSTNEHIVLDNGVASETHTLSTESRQDNANAVKVNNGDSSESYSHVRHVNNEGTTDLTSKSSSQPIHLTVLDTLISEQTHLSERKGHTKKKSSHHRHRKRSALTLEQGPLMCDDQLEGAEAKLQAKVYERYPWLASEDRPSSSKKKSRPRRPGESGIDRVTKAAKKRLGNEGTEPLTGQSADDSKSSKTSENNSNEKKAKGPFGSRKHIHTVDEVLNRTESSKDIVRFKGTAAHGFKDQDS